MRQVQRVTDTIATYLDLITASRARAAGLLVFVALCAFSPGFNAIPPVDRDEVRYAQASKQMMETGNYLDIPYWVALPLAGQVGAFIAALLIAPSILLGADNVGDGPQADITSSMDL